MNNIISIKSITSRIYFILGYKVMLDRDLAELYGAETSSLKEKYARILSKYPCS